MLKAKAKGNTFYISDFGAGDGFNLVNPTTDGLCFSTGECITIPGDTYKGFKVNRFNASITTDKLSEDLRLITDKNFKPNTKYVLSFWIKKNSSHTSSNEIHCYMYSSVPVCSASMTSQGYAGTSGDGDSVVQLSSNWQRVFITFTTRPDIAETTLIRVIGCRIYKGTGSSENVDISMCGFKFEEGDFPSPIK